MRFGDSSQTEEPVLANEPLQATAKTGPRLSGRSSRQLVQ